MHELSIAMGIVETLEAELADEYDIAILSVKIRVGALTGIVPDALQFVWPIACESTRLQGAKLAIESVEVMGYCPNCGQDRPIVNLQSFRCPVCNAPIRQITGGNALEILTVEVEDLASDG